MSPAPATNYLQSCSPDASGLSLVERFRLLPIEERRRLVEHISEEEADALWHDWKSFARPNQLEPESFLDGTKTNWLVKAGRGFGKTRVGAEQVRKWIKDFPIVNLVGPTAADVRDVMVQGMGAGSAIMEICRKDEKPVYEKSNRRLVWPNGANSLLFSAEEPERLRGPQHQKVWADEIAGWKYPDETWEQIEFGLRLGARPQTVITTTPKPTKLIRRLVRDPETVVTHGSTYDNKSNLAAKFYSTIINKYEGTRLGRQELMAELLEDNPGALWTLKAIDADRVKGLPQLIRAVLGIDPSGSSGEDATECGQVCAGVGPAPDNKPGPPHYYVFDDLSVAASPDGWAKVAVDAYAQHKLDRIVAEVNYGGDMVEALLRTKRMEFAYRAVHATRGKLIRAEPIAALYEQHRVHHVGAFPKLEDEMCDYVAGKNQKSPNRLDALVWALWELSNPDEGPIVVTHEEQVSISPDLDEFDMREDW